MKKIPFVFVFVCIVYSNSYGQKNHTHIYGTAPIDEVSSIDITEVTIYEWVHFIINNNFNRDFFPDSSVISNSTSVLFEDLKKERDFEYFTIIDYPVYKKGNYGDKGFKLTKKFRTLVDADTNYFSINNPIVGISFRQAQKFCAWREAVVNKTKAIKVRITLPTIAVYEKIIENKDSMIKKFVLCKIHSTATAW